MDSVSVLAAFAAGIVSFLSPCVLPLVPGYISIVSGISLEQLQSEERDSGLTRLVVFNSLFFIVGFSVTFISLGASATFLGQFIMAQLGVLYRLAGMVIIIFGLHLTGLVKIPFLYQDKRFHNVDKPRGMFGAFVLGLAFAFGWTPCLGPILAGILTFASTKETVGEGILLLTVYSAGLGLPFLLTSLGLNKFLSFYGRFKKHFHTVEVVSGVLVITVGVLILTNNFTRLSGYLSFLNRFAL
jgi:cytochrome c-type biogenesis protein